MELASPLSPRHLPEEWRKCPLVLLGPVAQEVASQFVYAFQSSFTATSLQGWLRRWDESGNVSPCPLRNEEFLSAVDLAFVSEEDLEEASWVDRWTGKVPILVVTRGRKGAVLYYSEQWHHTPAVPTREVDPTGAGDVFAAAFMVNYYQNRDPVSAAHFASAAASLSVGGYGLEACQPGPALSSECQPLKPPLEG